MKHPKVLFGTCIAVATMTTAFLSNVHATPYASSLSNNAGTISFFLNEGGGKVTITYEDGTTNANYNGVTTGTNLAAGEYSFDLGSHTSFAISVKKTGVGTPTKISVDSTNTYFPNPRGIGVNVNPNSPYFGRVYAANGAPNSSGTYGPLSYKGRGIYPMTPDLSLINGTNPVGSVFTSDSLSPNRLSVAADGDVYVSDCGPTAPNIWKFDPTITAATNQVLAYLEDAPGGGGTNADNVVHGRIASAPVVRGSTATGDLQIWDVDSTLGPDYNEIEYYDIGSGPLPWSNAPVAVVNLGLASYGSLLSQPPTDLDAAPNGNLFATFYRLNYAVPGLQVFDPSGNLLWDSITADGGTINSGPDLTSKNTLSDGLYTQSGSAYCVRVSPDGKYAAVMGIDNHITVMALTNGVPDADSLFIIDNTPTTGNARDINWDAADNLYAASSGQGLLRVYTLGQTTTAVTSNNAALDAGSFTLTTPATKVSVEATVAQASQSGPTPGVFTLTRSSVNPDDLNQAATVNYTLTGTATNTSYTVSGGTATSVTFAPGQTTTNVVITPINDGISRPTTTVTINLKGGSSYTTIAPSTATIDIQNTGPQLVFISSVPSASMYNAFSNDYVAVTLTRWGDTNAATYSVNTFTNSGTAVEGADFTTPTPVTFNPGDITNTAYIYPLISGTPPTHSTNQPYVGNKTGVLGLSSGGGYTAGTNTATFTIIDSANPPTTVLFSDPLTDTGDSANWNITAANNNMPNASPDYTVNFGYDLQNGDPYGPIPPPPSGAATALRITVNKNSAAGSGASTGVNLYRIGQSFSGDYAVRFNMNIIEGYNPSYTTEGPLFGINHDGTETNWWSGNSIAGSITEWPSDGVWYWVSVDGDARLGDYIGFTGNGGALPNTGWELTGQQYSQNFTGAFKTNVFTTTGGPGLVGNYSVENSTEASANNWADVEIKQINNTVTLSIDKTPILVYTNNTSFTSGTLMLGYEDPFSSVGTTDAAVYYSNLRVVRLGPPTISEIAVNNANNTVVINFTSVDGGVSAASFALQSATTVNGSFTDDSSAVITQLGTAAFQAVVPQNGPVQFYRIRQK